MATCDGDEREDSEDMPRLSAEALRALQDFVREQEDLEKVRQMEGENDGEMVKEDWRMSQFWYDENTSQTLAEELQLLTAAFSGGSIACIACPSLYNQMKKRFPETKVHLFEYDKRFSKYDDFIFYDYNHPEDLPPLQRHSFHVVVADPPYLSEECLEKTVKTMEYLAKEADTPLLLLTGSIQQDNALRLMNAHPCTFRPTHKSKLGNEFMLLTNYNPGDRLGGWERQL